MHRIRSARLTTLTFTPRYEFNPSQLLNHAWGIWYGSSPSRVVLKFSSKMAWRVLETRNHPSEKIEMLPDGSLIWSVDITGIQELVPWIRGWGADVEVLEPESLRHTLRDEVMAMVSLYALDRDS